MVPSLSWGEKQVCAKYKLILVSGEFALLIFRGKCLCSLELGERPGQVTDSGVVGSAVVKVMEVTEIIWGSEKRREGRPKATGNCPWSLLSKYSPSCGEDKFCRMPQNARRTGVCTLVRVGHRVLDSGMRGGLGCQARPSLPLVINLAAREKGAPELQL